MKTKEERRQYHASYHRAHREEILKRKRYLSKTKRGRSLNAIRSIRYYYRHQELVKKKNLDRLKEIKRIVFNHYGDKCACCGVANKEFLCMDHINGGGGKHRREIRKRYGTCGGYALYRWLLVNKFPTEFQILCWNCNSAKHFYKICPHKSGL